MDFNQGSNNFTLFVFKGDVAKEDKVLLLIARTIHSLAISFVFIGFIVTIIFSALNTAPRDVYVSDILLFSFLGIVIVFSGVFASWVVKHFFPIETSRLFIFVVYCLKLFFFLFPSTFVFFRRQDVPLIETLPFFMISLLALILSYPTRKRWAEWTTKCPALNSL
jgi:hypothetical protein